MYFVSQLDVEVLDPRQWNKPWLLKRDLLYEIFSETDREGHTYEEIPESKKLVTPSSLESRFLFDIVDVPNSNRIVEKVIRVSGITSSLGKLVSGIFVVVLVPV